MARGLHAMHAATKRASTSLLTCWFRAQWIEISCAFSRIIVRDGELTLRCVPGCVALFKTPVGVHQDEYIFPSVSGTPLILPCPPVALTKIRFSNSFLRTLSKSCRRVAFPTRNDMRSTFPRLEGATAMPSSHLKLALMLGILLGQNRQDPCIPEVALGRLYVRAWRGWQQTYPFLVHPLCQNLWHRLKQAQPFLHHLKLIPQHITRVLLSKT